jgi:transcriptional regulator with XRE-family HTH domain
MTNAIDVMAIRTAKGWTQHQMAEFCGVDRSTISKWEYEPPTKGPALILLRQLQEQISASEPAQ